MNERIKALMEQAKRPLGELRPKMANTGAKWDMVLDPAKFAELIVAECANIDFRAKLGLSGDDAFAVSESIKEHFGVEE